MSSRDGSLRAHLVGLAYALLAVAVVTAALYPISDVDPGVSSGVLYVLGVLLVATTRGLRMGLVAAVFSTLALDYFHTEPTGGLWRGKSAGDLVAITNVVLTAVVASVIADRARARAVESEERRVRLREVRASRLRVLAAGDQERRRVVRDLHDGAQQRLVHTVVSLRLADQLLDSDEPAARKMLAEALDHAQRATTELRELAHGILPSVLTHGGLRAAVDALAARTPLPVIQNVTDTRLTAEVEATAYFVVAEALTNVAKHAQADEARVTIAVDGAGGLRIEVSDDGVGGAWTGGSGFLGLEDRLSALDGQLEVRSPPDGGTVLVATIPKPADEDLAADRAEVLEDGEDPSMLGGDASKP